MASTSHGNCSKGVRMTAGRTYVRHEEPNYVRGREILSGGWGLHLLRALWDRVPACLDDLCSAVRRQQDRRYRTSHAVTPLSLLSCLASLNLSQMIPQVHLACAFIPHRTQCLAHSRHGMSSPCQLSSRTRGEVGRTHIFKFANDVGQTVWLEWGFLCGTYSLWPYQAGLP